MSEAKKQADLLRHEAKQHLNSLFKIPEGYGSGSVERLVDCIIFAAVLEVSALQAEAWQAAKEQTK